VGLLPDVPDIGPFDSLYVSPRPDEAAVACAGRILWERARGLKSLALTLCQGPPAVTGGPATSPSAATVRLGVEQLGLSAPDPSRFAVTGSPALEASAERDAAAWVRSVGEFVRDLAIRTRAQNVYLPLAVDPEHRLAHDAGMLVSQAAGTRNVFFYEERPYAFLPGSVRVRLAQLGARLPPGAKVADHGSLLRLLLRFHAAPYLGGVRRGWSPRVRWTRAALRRWMEARGWRPRRAYGPGLQPVVHAVDPELLAEVQDAVTAWARGSGRFPASPERLLALSAHYARKLGGDRYLERYWLLLPHRRAQGLTLQPTASVEDPLVV
jgi:hypothetical protein